MTVEFFDGCMVVDRTFNSIAAMFGGHSATAVVGSCMVDGVLMEFGVTFDPGHSTLVSAPHRTFTAREVTVTGAETDAQLLEKAEEAVRAMLSFESRQLANR